MRFQVGFDTSALDPEFKSHAHRGIGRYVSQLKGYFERNSHPTVDVGFFNHRDLFSGEIVRSLLKTLPAGVTTIRQQLIFPFKLAQLPYPVLHFPAHMDPPAWGRKPYILTVLDLIPLKLKHLYGPEKSNLRFHLARGLEIRAIQNAKLILAISEQTARDVHDLLHIPRERILVTPLGVDERFFAVRPTEPEHLLRERYGIAAGRPIILYVGGIDPRKNVAALLGVLEELIKEIDGPKPVLLMAGKIQNDKHYPELQAAIAAKKLDSAVIRPGFIPDNDLLQIYKIASVFFFPSRYEGFGLPPLEALAAGVPVVSSDTSCMPDILGDAALYAPPDDHQCAARHIAGILRQQDTGIIERGVARARQFSWEKTGALTMQAYERFGRGEFR